jgi:hypothetical protein
MIHTQKPEKKRKKEKKKKVHKVRKLMGLEVHQDGVKKNELWSSGVQWFR